MPGQTQLRKQYDATKLKIVQEAKASSIHHAAKKFGVDRQNIRRWRMSAIALQQLHGNAKRLSGAGRHIEWGELEAELTNRILFERSQQLHVIRKLIMEFMEKPDFVLRKGTRKPTLHDEEILNRGHFFILNVRRLPATSAIETKDIWNFGETTVFFDHSKDTTVHLRGAQDVPTKPRGLVKQRVTAIFCANANRDKQLPYLMLKSKPAADELPTARREGVVEVNMETSWMNSNAFIQYINFMFPFIVPGKTLFIFDAACSHIAQNVKEFLHERKIHFAVIPGGMIGFFQPGDFGWPTPLKAQLAAEIDVWKKDGPHHFTSGGRVKPPATCAVNEWLKRPWAVVSPSTIKLSFQRCVLGQDSELHLSRHERFSQMLASTEEVKENDESEQDFTEIVDEIDDLFIIDDN